MNKLEQKLTSIMFSLGWNGEYPSNWDEIDKLGWLLDTIKQLVTDEQSKLGLHFKIEAELPETGEDDYFYLVPAKNEVGQDIYAEYLWIDDKFEKLGSTDIKIENYFTKEEVNDIIKTVNDSLTDESTARQEADTLLLTNINQKIDKEVANAKVYIDAKIESEASERSTQDSALDEKINNLSSDLTSEITNRTTADKNLQDYLDTEVTNRTNADADLTSSISSLSKTVSENYTLLNNNLNAEITRAKTEESRIEESCASKEKELTEKIENSLTEAKSYTDTNISTEASARSTKDDELQKNIDAANLKIETTASAIRQEIPTKVSQLDNDGVYITKDVDNLTNYYSSTAVDEKLALKLDADKLPTKLSAFENDQNFIDSTVDDLENYYLKTDLDKQFANKLDSSTAATTYETKEAANTSHAELKAKDTELASAIDEKQSKSDDTLTTTSKEIVGAINELNTNLSSEKTRAEDAENVLAESITTINNKIPSQASDANQLADKDFVNSSIATSTASFQGTVDSKEELKALTGDLNDYAYVKTTDATSGLVIKYDRYKYSEVSSEETGNWTYEYTLNNSSFTDAQWKSITSGITEELVEKITSNESSISSEITRAEDAERNLKNLIDSKVQTGWAYIDNKVSDEETRATEKESELEDKITSNSNNITTLTTNLTSEISRAKQEESALKTSLDSNTADIATLNTSLTSETSNREEADTALTTSINEEVARATAAEKTNSDNITAEATRATDAEVVLEKMISDEVARATNAETANSTAITTETNRAKDEETSIKSDLTTETDRAIGQEKILQSNISSLETALSTKISANATSISSLDTLTAAHTASIDTLTASINAEIDRATEREDEIANSVTTEASARMTKDADLQTQIDAINLRSDCVDIVATKAALDAYDKTSLTDNDIIKVLSDESSDSKISYYKYSTADSTYTLIGAIGPFSTISETEEKISAEETRAKGVEALLESSITSGDDSTLATAKEYTDSKVITDYVTLSTDQTVSGSKTFSSDIAAPNIRQSTQSPEYSTFNATCGITPRWFSTCGGDDGTFFIIDLSNTAFPFVDMFIGGNNETPTQKWAVVYDESGTLNYALNAVEMELRIHKHRVDQKYADVYITDHRDGKIVNDSVSGGYVVIYSTKNLMFEGYVGTSTDFYSTTKPSWFDASALSEKYNSRFVSKDDFDALVTRVAALESTADKEY